jgi:hypothetical protein
LIEVRRFVLMVQKSSRTKHCSGAADSHLIQVVCGWSGGPLNSAFDRQLFQSGAQLWEKKAIEPLR